MITPKGWGYEDELVNEAFCGKRMLVREQHRCSLHHHKEKDEVLLVGNDDGVLYFESGDDPGSVTGMFLQANDRVRVRPGTWHRFTALRQTCIYEFSTHHDDSDSYRHVPSGRITDDEYKALLAKYFKDQNSDKILTASGAGAISAAIRGDGRTIGFCNGCFDLMHLGHVSLLAEAKDRCDVLFVAINSDESVRALKGSKRPFVDQRGRVGLLASNRYVDYVVLSEGETCLEALDAVDPHVYVTTSECEQRSPEAKKMRSLGRRVEVVDMIGGYNTTEISKKIADSK